MNRTWAAWFLATVVPGAIAEVGLQTHGLPLPYGVALMIFILITGVAVAEIMEISDNSYELEIVNNIDDDGIEDDIDRELNGRE